jgi:hypothetical protein
VAAGARSGGRHVCASAAPARAHHAKGAHHGGAPHARRQPALRLAPLRPGRPRRRRRETERRKEAALVGCFAMMGTTGTFSPESNAHRADARQRGGTRTHTTTTRSRDTCAQSHRSFSFHYSQQQPHTHTPDANHLASSSPRVISLAAAAYSPPAMPRQLPTSAVYGHIQVVPCLEAHAVQALGVVLAAARTRQHLRCFARICCAFACVSARSARVWRRVWLGRACVCTRQGGAVSFAVT